MEAAALQQAGQETIVKVEGLSKSYPLPEGKLDVLHDLSFEVKRGEFVAITGPSGSGKTTLLALLGAMDKPDSGEIWLDEVAVHTLSGVAAARFRRQKVGFVFQLFYLLPNLTALENVMAPLMPFRHRLDFDLEQRATELLQQVGLGQRLAHVPGRLSGGEQQRVAIARALINRPAVLLADEPTGNLDPATGMEILDLLRAQQEQGHQTLILVTHDPAVAARADRLIRLRAAAAGLEIEGIDEAATPRRIFMPDSDTSNEQAPVRRKPRLPRRAVLIALGAALLAAGGFVWFETRPASTPQVGDTLYIYRGHSSSVNAVSWSPDGRYVASASAPLTLQQWRQASAQQFQSVYTALTSGHADASVHVWNPANGHHFTSYRGHVGGPATVMTSPDGRQVASGGLFDHTVQVWEPLSGKTVLTDKASLAGKTSTATGVANGDGAIWSLAWSPDGTRIASGDGLHRVQVWDAATGKLFVTYTKHSGPINALAWSPDGTSIVSASADNTVQVWDATTGAQRLVYTRHSQGVRAVFWASDGQSILSAGADGIIWAWDASNGNPIWLYKGHTAPVNALAWSPDNSQLLSASDDRTVRLWANWQNSSGKALYTYHGHTGAVLSASWSDDGTRIASGSSDKTVRLWIASVPVSG